MQNTSVGRFVPVQKKSISFDIPSKKQSVQKNQQAVSKIPQNISAGEIAIPIILSSDNYLCSGHCISLPFMMKEHFLPLNKKNSQRYVRIGARVYRGIFEQGYYNNTVGLYPMQYADAELQKLVYMVKKEHKITLQPFSLENEKINRVNKLVFDISLNRDIDLPGINPKKLHIKTISKFLSQNLKSSFVGYHQIFLISLQEGHFQISVKKMNFRKNVNSENHPVPYGYIDTKTVFKFKNCSQDLKIIEKEYDKDDFKMKFSLSLHNAETLIGQLVPPLVDLIALKKQMMEKLANDRTLIGDKYSIKSGKNIFKLQLNQVLTGKSVTELEEQSSLTSYPCRNIDQIEFINQKNAILFEGKTNYAVQVVVEVEWFKKFEDTSKNEFPKIGYVDASEVREFLLNSFIFSKKQYFALKIPQGLIQCRFKKICGDPKEARFIKKNSLWGIDRDTEIKIEIASALKNLAIVDEKVPHPIKKVKIEVSSADSNTQFTISQSLLVEGLLNCMNKVLVPNQTFNLNFKDYPKIHLKLTDLEYADLEKSSIKYAVLGSIEGNTDIEFTTKMHSIKILVPGKELETDDPIKELENLGVGGLSKEVAKVLRRIVKFKRNKEKLPLGVKPTKGILLFGEPGLGKSRTAEYFAGLIGKFKRINGTELLDKWVGSSEKNTRALFNLDGIDIIIIEECDAVFSRRFAGDHKVHDRVVNAFLGGMDTTEKLFIMTTNAIDQIDPALLRPGRFDIQLELTLPDEDGRLEIFKIYTKNRRDSGLLDSSVDLAELAHKTEDFSGADIERVVSIANELAGERQLASGKSSEILTMTDFKNAFKQFKIENRKKDTNSEKVRSYFM